MSETYEAIVSADVRTAIEDDEELFLGLWEELIADQASNGGMLLPTEKTMGFFANLFRLYVTGKYKGAVLFGANDNSVLMWGEFPGVLPFDHVFGEYIQGWGIYVRDSFRRMGWSSRLRNEAIIILKGQGFKTMVGEFLLGNDALGSSLSRYESRIHAQAFSINFDRKKSPSRLKKHWFEFYLCGP